MTQPSENVPSDQSCADSEGPDQTAQMRSLIRAFTVRKQNHWKNVWIESKGTYNIYFAHAWDHLNRRVLCLFEGTVSLDAVYVLYIITHERREGVASNRWLAKVLISRVFVESDQNVHLNETTIIINCQKQDFHLIY